MLENKKEIHIVFEALNFLHSDSSIKFSLLPNECRLLINLASHKGLKGIYPSIPTLMRELKLSQSQIYRLIKSLEQKSLIKIEHYPGKSNHYNLFIPLSAPVTHDTPVTGDTPVTHDTPPLSPVRKTPVTHDTLYNKRSNKRNNRERAREKRAPLSASFFPNEKSTALIQEMGYSEEEAQIIYTDFREHYLDSDIVSKQWQQKLIKWFRNEKREPGFLNGHGGNGNGHVHVNNKSLEIDTIGKTYVRTPENEKAGKEALAIIMGNLGVKPNGLLGKIRANGSVGKKGT